MNKVYLVKLDGEDCRLENGFFECTEAVFSSKENADMVCDFMNARLKEQSSDILVIGEQTYYVDKDGFVYEKYSVEEEDVYDSAGNYIEKLKTFIA